MFYISLAILGVTMAIGYGVMPYVFLIMDLMDTSMESGRQSDDWDDV
ncbi:MAG: hypothetical protein QQN63_08500 [Nitrosopumilus sp.]